MRAWAVTCVVLYHWHVPGFDGGLLGVDAFFVVSGYLMTDILLRSLATDTFNYPAFLLARARRIWPGLWAMVALVLLLGARFTPPQAYAETAQHALSALIFRSNHEFLAATNYFAAPSHHKWLLHTWSLSLEWQFYLVWPLALWGAHRLGLKGRAWMGALALGLAGSLALGIWATTTHPGAAFYTLPCRAWELLVGAAIAAWSLDHPSSAAQARPWLARTGWALLAVQPWLLGGLTWPGPWAILPCLATALVLLGRHESPIAVRHPLVAALGRWSYAIYLVHWPIHVAWLALGWTSHPTGVAAGIGLSVALGALLHRWVEQPTRHWLPTTTSRSALLTAKLPRAAAFGSALVAASVLITHHNGLPQRFDPKVQDLESATTWYSVYRDDCLTFPQSPLALGRCSNRDDGSPVGLYIWGDSHGDAILRAFNNVTTVHTEFSGHAGCAPVEGGGAQSARCAEFAAMALDHIERAPAGVPVLVIGRFTDYTLPEDGRINPVRVWWQAHQSQPAAAAFLDAMEHTLCRLATRRPVHVLRPLPEMDAHVPMAAAQFEILHGQFGDDTIAIPARQMAAHHAAVNARLDRIAQRCGVHLIDPLPMLCPDGLCRAAANGQPMFIDRDHLSTVGSNRLAPQLASRLADTDPVVTAELDTSE